MLGNARAIVPNREAILECLALAKPTGIVSVPVLFNRVSLIKPIFLPYSSSLDFLMLFLYFINSCGSSFFPITV